MQEKIDSPPNIFKFDFSIFLTKAPVQSLLIQGTKLFWLSFLSLFTRLILKNSLCSLWDQMVMILGLTGKTRVSWFPVSIARPIGVLSCFRMLGLFFSAVTEKLKVKSYPTILNVKDSQKAFADVNFKVLK